MKLSLTVVEIFSNKNSISFSILSPPPNVTRQVCFILIGLITGIILGNISVSFNRHSLVP
jgi:hypothetical protein